MKKKRRCHLKRLNLGDEGSRFTVTGLLDGEFTIPVYGAHQVKNALAAILIANEVAISVDDIRAVSSQSVLNGYAYATGYCRQWCIVHQ